VSGSLPEMISRYEIRREIGRGMMGIVYEAYDPSLDRVVALKTISLAFAVSDKELLSFEERFFNEARMAGRLSHPGIVIVHDVGRDETTGTLFITLEYLRGRTLARMIASGRPLEWREALRLSAKVGRALHHAHSQGIIHRDMKPANVMVLDTGEPKIMDFGIAKIATAEGGLTFSGEFFGTPLYMAPEQALGAGVDGRTDLFSLGSITYTLLVGRPAFEAENVPLVLSRVAQDTPPSPSEVIPGIPKGVDEILARAMAKDPADRYPDGDSLASDIERVLEGAAPRDVLARPGEVVDLPVELLPVEDTEDDVARAGTWDLSALVTSSPTAPPPLALDAKTPSRRALLLGATALILGLGAFVFWAAPRGAPPAAPTPGAALPEAGSSSVSESPGPTQGMSALAISVEHPLKTGTLTVFLDKELVLTEHLAARTTKKVLFFEVRKGLLTKELEVTPGPHVVRLEVRWDDKEESDVLAGTFKPGVTRHLHAKVGRLLKDLSLQWQ
jgi:serine/threonine protein kinase